MLIAAHVRRSRDKRKSGVPSAGSGALGWKSKHPENAFSVQVASGNSTHAFVS